ncbi:MAG: hypothetical protein AAF732_15860 [Pseudomonadota bacterium]
MLARGAQLLLTLSIMSFGVFFTNVVFGATGRGVFLSDVGELLVLFTSCAIFVASTLLFEHNKKMTEQSDQD